MRALTNLRAWLLAAVLLIKAVMAGPTVYTPVKPPITFYWSVTDPYNFTLPSCNQLQITIVINPNTLIQPVPPFSLFVAPIGLPPVIQQTNALMNQTFFWNARYPAGTQVVFSMIDSIGNSGGVVGPYNIVESTGSTCQLTDQSANLRLSTSPSSGATCDKFDVAVRGGSAPYTLNMLAPTTGTYISVPRISSSPFTISNIFPAGVEYYYSVSDSAGASVVSAPVISGLNSETCSPDTGVSSSSSSSSHTGAIVGGVIGGVLFLVIVFGLFYWLHRRRQQMSENHASSEHASEDDQKQQSDFLPDGQAPAATPFVVPMTDGQDQERAYAGQRGLPLSVSTLERFGNGSGPSAASSAGSSVGYSPRRYPLNAATLSYANVVTAPSSRYVGSDDGQDSSASVASPASIYGFSYPASAAPPRRPTSPNSTNKATYVQSIQGSMRTSASVAEMPDRRLGLAPPEEFAFREGQPAMQQYR